MKATLFHFAALAAFTAAAPVPENTMDPYWSNPKRCPPFPVSPCDQCPVLRNYWSRDECYTYCIDPSFWPDECSLVDRTMPSSPLLPVGGCPAPASEKTINLNASHPLELDLNFKPSDAVSRFKPFTTSLLTHRANDDDYNDDITALFSPTIAPRVNTLVHLIRDLLVQDGGVDQQTKEALRGVLGRIWEETFAREADDLEDGQ